MYNYGIDIDECINETDDCEEYCNNTIGSYYCSCDVGYELVNTTDCTGKVYIIWPASLHSMSLDTIECDNDNGGCEHYCTNTEGSFYCTCQEGYRLADNGTHCKGKLVGIFHYNMTKSGIMDLKLMYDLSTLISATCTLKSVGKFFVYAL